MVRLTTQVKRASDILTIVARHGFLEIVERWQLRRFVPQWVSPELPYDERTHPGPENFCRMLEELGPVFIKIGQFLSARPDLLPVEYIQELQVLQDHVQPVSFEQIREVVETDLGIVLEQEFQQFDSTPLASASIGQIHAAVLRDGRAVVVKVQRPNIADQMEPDLALLGQLAAFIDSSVTWMKKYRLPQLIKHLKQRFLDELDFTREQHNMVLLRKNLESFKRIHVPEVEVDLSSRRVLTMERIYGHKVSACVGSLTHSQSSQLASDYFTAFLKQVFADGFFHCDPHPGNVLIETHHEHRRSPSLVLLDYGLVAHLSARHRELLLQLILNFSASRGDAVAQLCLELGSADESLDRRAFISEINAIVDLYHSLPIERRNIGQGMLMLVRTAFEHNVSPAPELSLLAKTMACLDASCMCLQPDFDPLELFRSGLWKIIKYRVWEELSLPLMLSSGIDVKRTLFDLPVNLRMFLSQWVQGETRMNVALVDREEYLRAIRAIANRLSIGLISSALIVGSALLIRSSPPDLEFFGYPIISLFGFLGAAGLGLYLMFKVFQSGD